MWISNINAPCLKDFTSDERYHSYYVCNRHFATEFLVVGTRTELSYDAVPTLYLPEVERDNRIEQHGRSENPTPPMLHEMRDDMDLQIYPPSIIDASAKLTSCR
ncbi:hypothetical protein FQA39_LY14766 [Lamprigera yunnana]|nr:hypothetical protein FQA39_LY14766 [Lamprigera yunnana]